MDPHKSVPWQLIFDRLQAYKRHYRFIIYQMNSDIFVHAFNILDILQVDSHQLIFRLDKKVLTRSLYFFRVYLIHIHERSDLVNSLEKIIVPDWFEKVIN